MRIILFTIMFSMTSLMAKANDAEVTIVDWLSPLVDIGSFSLAKGNSAACQSIQISNAGSKEGRFASISLSTNGGGDTIYDASMESDKHCSIDSSKVTLTCQYPIGSGGVFGGNDGHYSITLTKNASGGLSALSFNRQRKSTQEATSISCQN